MTDIEDDSIIAGKLVPVPARDTGVYQEEISVAQLMAKSSLLPKHLHANPGNCLAVLMLSRDWNMNPIAVGLKTSVIPKKGGGETLMFEGQLVNAIITNSKKLNGRLIFDLSGDGHNTVCIVRGTVKGEQAERTVTVGMPKTQNSPLWSGNQGDKEQQLTYLAARVWCRRHLPEVLLGVYTPEDPWEERASDEVLDRNNAVRSRVAALENNPAPVIESDQDDFIDVGGGEPTEQDQLLRGGRVKQDSLIIATIGGKPLQKMADAAHEQAQTLRGSRIEMPDHPVMVGTSDGLYELLDEPIPDFAPKKFNCATCEDTGLVEDEPDSAGVIKKVPCFICKKGN
jgi:hypothetical protein